MFEDDVDGKVIMGIYGGNSVGAARGLAKEVAKKAKKVFSRYAILGTGPSPAARTPLLQLDPL